MKKIILGLFLVSSLTAFSQNVELTGGLNKNNFFDFKQDEGHYSSTYNPEYGYAVKLGIDNIQVDWLTLRFTVGYEKYGGELTVTDGGLGGENTTDAKIDKSVISVGVYPLNFKIINRIDLNFGFEVSGLISEDFSGTNTSRLMDEPNPSYNLNDEYDRYSSKAYFGLCGRIAYDFNISDTWAISPQYSYYLGLTNEFDEFPDATKSMRHYLGIGIQRKIK